MTPSLNRYKQELTQKFLEIQNDNNLESNIKTILLNRYSALLRKLDALLSTPVETEDEYYY